MKKVSTAAAQPSRIFSQQKLTGGLDLGDRNSWFCVVDDTGKIQLEQQVRTSTKALQQVFGAMPRSRIALEIGTHSPWISRWLGPLGHEVIVANGVWPRQLGCPRRAGFARLGASVHCPVSPHPTRYYGNGDLHFITFSCYRRLPLLASARRSDLFLRTLEAVRRQYRFVVVGYVVMPEHVHLLLSELGRRNLSVVLKALKQGVARRVLSAVSRPNDSRQTELFPGFSVSGSFWQARFYDFNVWSSKKRVEKLRYMHRNPVKRGLVALPEEWRWSSFRAYACGEKGLVAVNAEFPRQRAGTV